MDTERAKVDVGRFVGPLLGSIALIFFAVSLTGTAQPGVSARFIVNGAGLAPKMTPAYPLWMGVAWLVARVPIGGLALRLNLLSAVCGAAVVWLLYGIVADLIAFAIYADDDGSTRPSARIAPLLAGAGAALFLMFCVPFQVAASRAHVATFDLLLLIAATRLFVDHLKRGQAWTLYVFAFLYGLGTVEFATFAVLAPVFGLVLLLRLAERRILTAGLILRVAACATCGLASLLVVAAWFHGTVGYEIKEYGGYWRLVLEIVRTHYILIVRSLPRVGWLIVIVMAVVPWLASLLVARSSLSMARRIWHHYALHIVMAGISIMLLLNIRFTPYAIFGFSRLLVTPYVLAAMVFGYLVASLFLVPTTWWQTTRSQAKLRWRRRIGPILVIPLAGAVLAAPFHNSRYVDTRPGAAAAACAGWILDDCEGRRWLVTDGGVDDNILVAARDRGVDINLLNIRLGDNETYLRHVARMFDEPRLKNLAQINLVTLLPAWLRADPAAGESVAIMILPEIWAAAGYTAVPSRLVFLGSSDFGPEDATQLAAEHARFWEGAVPEMRALMAEGTRTGAAGVLRRMSLVANNLGVLCQDLGKQAEAFEAYRQARDIDPENVSSLLNMARMVEEGYETDLAADLQKDVEKLIGDPKRMYHAWHLARSYGFVREPMSFVQLGLTWVLSGQPSIAVSGLRRTVELLPDAHKGHAREALAWLHLRREQAEKSREIYRGLLDEDVKNVRAMIGLAQAEAQAGRLGEAKRLLKEAQAAGGDRAAITAELAAIHLMAGQVDLARVMSEELVELNPRLARGWHILLLTLLRKSDSSALEEYSDRLVRADLGSDLLLGLADGYRHLATGDFVQARRGFTKASEADPRNTHVLEMLLRLDVAQNSPTSARADALRLLRVDAGNAFANHIMGSLHFKEGRHDLAEDSFRASMERRRTPELLNDLAWLLAERGRYPEAEKLSREALAAKQDTYSFWDTLGYVLTKARRLDEASEAFDRALSLNQNDLEVFLHAAELAMLRKDESRMSALVAVLKKSRNRLSLEGQRKLDDIERALRKKE